MGIVLESGYADNKDDYEFIKTMWKRKNPHAKVKRVKTDTKGLIMYVVELTAIYNRVVN